MKKIILVVEDTPEEVASAKEVLTSDEVQVVIATTLHDALRMTKVFGQKLSGIITDLHIPESEAKADASKPQGLAVVVEAIKAEIPTVICSDVNHHDADYLKIVTGHFSVPFIMDRKDWVGAFKQLSDI